MANSSSFSSTPLLVPLSQNIPNISVDKQEFIIGRAVDASFDIKSLLISRTHCIISFKTKWVIRDKSSSGTWLNSIRLPLNKDVPLKDGDLLKLGISHEYCFVFCYGEGSCSKSCSSRKCSFGAGLNAELAQRRRIFEYKASLEKDDLQQTILKSQRNRHSLEKRHTELLHNFSLDLSNLEERLQQQQKVLEENCNVSSSKLIQEREKLERDFRLERAKLEEIHEKNKSDLESKMLAYQVTENELKKKNQELLERLDNERILFEKRLEEERKVLEMKLAEQLAEQQKLTMEKMEVEEALRSRIRNLEEVAHVNDEQIQEKNELEKRLQQLAALLEEKERQESQKERELKERDQQLQAQEEQREQDRKKLELESLAREEELKELRREMEIEMKKREELEEKEAELRRLAAEREADRVREQEEIKLQEQKVRQQLELEIAKLQEEKQAIELNIRGELDKKEGENAEHLKQLTSELDSVKNDLATTSSKLEKELKEAASESGLKAKNEVIANFGDLFETELQCSICSELFVMATSLNCNHTFCHECISNWLSKKKDCPICRSVVTQRSRSLVLDNFIDRMVENLSEELKIRRKTIVEERKESERETKRRKVDEPVAQPINQLPLQVINGNTMRIMVPVSTVPASAGSVIHIRAATTTANGGIRLIPASSTSQPLAQGQPRLQWQGQGVPHPSRQPRPQLVPMQPQLSAPQSSSAPIRMTPNTNQFVVARQRATAPAPQRPPQPQGLHTVTAVRSQGILLRTAPAPAPAPVPRGVQNPAVRPPGPAQYRGAAAQRQGHQPRPQVARRSLPQSK